MNGLDLLDYAIWRPGAPDGVGDLLRGRVEAVVPRLGGLFVALPVGSGFLPMHNGMAVLGVGDAVLVTITRGAQGGKGPRLHAVPAGSDLPVTGSPALLQLGPNPMVRLAAAYPDADILADDPSFAASLSPQLRARTILTTVAIPPELEGLIDALAGPDVALPGGLRASICPTPALVAIDLDTAAASTGRESKQAAQFAANRAAIAPLLHQLRLRNLSGPILIDLAGLASRKRMALRPEVEAALSRDPLQPRLLGFTSLGLMEILRPRVHAPLHELLTGPHASALAGLREAANHARMPPHRVPDLRAGIGVIASLQQDCIARESFVRLTGRPISIRMDPSLAYTGWVLDFD
ncbi:MAG: ribonuclease E/G [Janthinobacterium lividum]